MMRDFAFCAASRDGRCATRACDRFVTASLLAESADRLPWVDFYDGCRIKTEARDAARH